MTKTKKVSPIIKELFGYPESISDAEFLNKWKQIISSICKPCWEIKYCPFGPLVEDFPLIPPTRREAI